MSDTSRRDFIKFIGVYLLARPDLALAKKSSNRDTHRIENLIINSAPAGSYGSYKEIVVSPPGSVEIYNLVTKKIHQIPLPFFGHTTMQNPTVPSHLYTFEQYGRRGSLVDIKNYHEVTSVMAEKGNVFMGHSIFVPNKNVILTTEQNHKTTNGILTVRDPLTLKQLDKFSTHGLRPHDCHYIPELNAVAVINVAGPSNISYLDVNSGKVIKQIKLANANEINFNHFEISNDNWICAGPNSPSPHAVLISPDGKTINLQHSANIPNTSILSIAFSDTGSYVAVTYPKGKFVSVWNYKTQEHIALVNLPSPKGILSLKADPKKEEFAFLVSLEFEKGLRKISYSKTKKLQVSQYDLSFGGTGTHLVRAIIS